MASEPAPSPSTSIADVTAAVKNQIMFLPDGSARDTAGNLNSGILYIAGSDFRQHARHHGLGSQRQNSRLALAGTEPTGANSMDTTMKIPRRTTSNLASRCSKP